MKMNACQRWFQSHRGTPGVPEPQREPQLTERQKWTRDNFDFLRTTLCAILKQKVYSGLPSHLLLKPVQQWADHPDGRPCT